MSSGTPRPASVPGSRPPDASGSAARIIRTTPLDSAPPPIPDHELIRPIGEGGFGEVWLARNAVGTFRAVKVVHRRDFEREDNYEREFKGLQRFEPISRSHDGFVDILHLGRNGEAGYFYYVMELADNGSESRLQPASADEKLTHRSLLAPDRLKAGLQTYSPRTLRHDLKHRGHLPLTDCVSIGLKLCSALDHLHEQGLVHRDIKPSNIIFVNGEPKLADIGLVANIDDARSIVGTRGYIPPEGAGTPQADIYGLGKVLYEIAFGKDRQDYPQLPPDLSSRPDHAGLLELNEVIVKACESDPRKRYQSATGMKADLALLQNGKSVRRKRTNEQRWVAGKKAALALIVLGAITANLFIFLRPFSHAESAGEGPPSTNEYATALCDKAMSIMRADNYAAFPEAYTDLNKAIALDPNYARPYVGLFDLRSHLPVSGLPPPTQVELRAIVRKLEELAPNLAATHQAQSLVSFHDLNFPQAEKRILQALGADPKVDPGWYGFMLTHWGRLEEARKQLEIARSNTPSLAITYRIMGHTYYVQRDYTNAIAWYRQALNLEPHEVASRFIGEAYWAMGDYTNALDSFAKARILNGADKAETKRSYDELRRAFDAGGVRGYWEEQWKRTEKNPNSDFCGKATIQMRLGDTNAALAWLKKAYNARDRDDERSELAYLLFNECWDDLNDDVQFKDLLDKIGFTKVMPKRKK